jgi:hypothetical protein
MCNVISFTHVTAQIMWQKVVKIHIRMFSGHCGTKIVNEILHFSMYNTKIVLTCIRVSMSGLRVPAHLHCTVIIMKVQ